MIEFKQFVSRNIDECTNLFLKVFSGEPWNDQWESFNQAREYLVEFLENPGFEGFIVSDNDRIVGACFGHKRSWWKGKEFYIDEIFIDNEMQGRGIGSGLLDFVKARLLKQEIQTLVLLTEKGLPAELFYKKNGFHSSETNIFMFYKI